VTSEPDVVKLCANAFATAWERGTDHAEFNVA
jgi:hypothetical protein